MPDVLATHETANANWLQRKKTVMAELPPLDTIRRKIQEESEYEELRAKAMRIILEERQQQGEAGYFTRVFSDDEPREVAQKMTEVNESLFEQRIEEIISAMKKTKEIYAKTNV